MSHAKSSRSRRSSRAPSLPQALARALGNVRENPANESTWDELEEACRELERPEEGATAYSEVMESDAPEELRISIGLRAANFCEEWFEEPEPVIDMLRRVLAISPTHQEAFERLTVLLTVSSRWSELLSAYDAALAVAEEPEEKARLLEEAAKVARDFAGNSQLGSDYLKALLLLKPGDDHLASILEKRLDEQRRHQDLVDIWLARLSVVEPSQARSTRLQIAARQLDALQEADAALATIDEYLNSGGAPEDALQLLDRTAQSEVASVAVRRAALGKLARIEEAGENWPRVADAIERELALLGEEPEAAELHRRVAIILRRIGRPEEALSHGAAVMKLAANDAEVRAMCRELAEEVGRVGLYVQALVVASDACVPAEIASGGGQAEDDSAESQRAQEVGLLRVDLLMEAAGLADATLEDVGWAVQLYVRLADDPSASDSARLLSCRRLCVRLEEQGDRSLLLHYLVRRAELETDSAERREVLGRAAALADELGDVDQSLLLWDTRLADDGEDLVALSAKIDLLERSERAAGLVEALEARAKVSPDAEMCRRDLVQAAGIYRDALGDLTRAVERWQEVEARFGRVFETVDQLVELLRAAQRHEEVAELLGESVASMEGLEPIPTERLVVQLGLLGDTLRLALTRPKEAISAYAKALRYAPTDETARTGLRSLLADEDLAHAASEELVSALRAAGEGKAIIELSETRLAVAPDASFQAEVLREVAVLWEHAGDAAAAADALRRAFALRPSAETESELLRLAEAASTWHVAADAYVQAAERCQDEARLFSLHRAHGQVAEDRLQDLPRATQAFGLALAESPTDLATAQSVARVGLGAGLFREAALALVQHAAAVGRLDPELADYFENQAGGTGAWEDVLSGVADAIASQSDVATELLHDLKQKLAIWYRDCADDVDSAELVLRRAVLDLPKEDSLRMLAALQRRAPGRLLVDTLLKLAEVTGGELAALREAGEVALRIGDPASAEILEQARSTAAARFAEAYPQGRDVESSDAEGPSAQEAEVIVGWAIDGLVSLAVENKNAEEALRLLAEAVELPFAAPALVARRYQAAEVAAGGGLDDRAVELGEALLSEVPDHAPTIGLLSRLHETAGRLEQLLELRRRELALEPPRERRLFLRLDQARVMGELGASADERLAILRDNLEQQPGEAETVDAMENLLCSVERYEEAADLLESQASVVVRTDRPRASRMWLRAGRLAEEQLADVSRLETDYRAAVKASPDAHALDRLAELAHEARSPHLEVSWLEQRLVLAPAASDGDEAREERREVVRRFGAALVAAEDFARARELLETELSVDPGADAARRILLDLYSSFEEWSELSSLLSSGVDYAPTTEAQVDYLRRAAIVERRKLDNVGRAVELLDLALTLAPESRELRVMLADCLLESGGLGRARELLTALLEEFGRRRTKERASVHKLLAQIARAEGNLDEALGQAEEAAKIERMDPSILMLLAELARERGDVERAEQAYRTLALVVSRRKAPPIDEEESFGEAVILFELYQIASARGNDEQARELLSSALEVATRSNQEALQLEQSLRAVGKADLLLAAIEQQLAAAEGVNAAGLLVTRAVILEKNGEHDTALEARLSALRLAPQSSRVIEGARRLAERMNRLEPWLACLTDLAEQHAGNPEIAGDLWYRLGRAAEGRDDLAAAADLYERAQATGHRPRRAFLALDGVLARLGNEERIQAALSRFVQAPQAGESGETLADALYRLAEFELGEGRVDVGAEHLLAATHLRADDGRTLGLVQPTISAQVATPGLVRLFLDVAVTAGDVDTQLAAYMEAAKLEDVAEGTLDRGIELARQADAGMELRSLLRRRIWLAEEQGALVDVRAELLDLADLAEADRDMELAAELLEKVVPLLEDEQQLEQRLRWAGLLSQALGQLDRARPIYEALLSEYPAERRVWQPLLELYRRQGDSDAVEQCILTLEPQVEDRGEREVLRMARIRLMVEAGRVEEAEEALRTTLEEEPDSQEAAQVLVELLRKAERFEELRSLLVELFDKARERGDAEQVVSHGLELARAYADRPAEAAAILTSGLDLGQSSESYLKTLLALQGPDAALDDRGSVLGHLIEVAPSREAEEYTWQLIALRESQGDDLGIGRALELGQAAVPDSITLSDRLVEYLRNHEDYSALADLLMKRARARSQVGLALEEFVEAAHLYQQTLGEPARAAEAMLAAFERQPDQVVYLRRAADYLVMAGEIDAALAKLGELIDQGDELVLADLLDQRAKILESERGDDLEALQQAARDLRAALEHLLPEEQEADIQERRSAILESLRAIHGDRGEVDRERDVVLELAAARAERGEAAAAVVTLSSWVAEHPDDIVVARKLGETAAKAGEPGAALQAYQAIFDATSGEERRLAGLSLSVMAERAGDPMRAREPLEEIFREFPGDDEVRKRLRATYEAAGAFRELADLLMGEAATLEDPEQRFPLLVEVGELFLSAGDTQAACDVFESARQLEPGSYLIVTKLAQAYIDQGEVDRAQAALDDALDHHGKRRTPDLALLQHGLAIVAEARGDVDGMFSWLEAALMSDRSNGHIATELAVRAQDSGRNDIAIKALQVIALSKGTEGMSKAEAYHRQAQIAEEQGDPKKALMLARRATTADADFQPAQDLVARLS